MRDFVDFLFIVCSRIIYFLNDICKINLKVIFVLSVNIVVNILLIDFNFIMIDLVKYYMYYVMV